MDPLAGCRTGTTKSNTLYIVSAYAEAEGACCERRLKAGSREG